MFRNPYADVIVVLVILLLFFGPKRLPTLGRSLGSGLREFKDSIAGHDKAEDDEQRPELTQASDLPAQPVAPVRERESAEVGTHESRS